MATRTCRSCREIKSVEYFDKRKGRKENSYYTLCVICRNEKNRTHYQIVKQKSPFKLRCYAIKSKCVQEHLPYDLDPEYLESLWDGKCAISGKPLDLYVGRGKEMTAELDRVVPELGYVKGNVNWVNHRYNRIKCDASIEDLELILDYLKSRINND